MNTRDLVKLTASKHLAEQNRLTKHNETRRSLSAHLWSLLAFFGVFEACRPEKCRKWTDQKDFRINQHCYLTKSHWCTSWQIFCVLANKHAAIISVCLTRNILEQHRFSAMCEHWNTQPYRFINGRELFHVDLWPPFCTTLSLQISSEKKEWFSSVRWSRLLYFVEMYIAIAPHWIEERHCPQTHIHDLQWKIK